MVFCGECGSQLTDGAKFCGECGTPCAVSPKEKPPSTTIAEATLTKQEVNTHTPSPAPKGGENNNRAFDNDVDSGNETKKREFESPHMQRIADSLKTEVVVPSFNQYLEDKTYKLKAANKGITKHVNKLWEKGCEEILRNAPVKAKVQVGNVYQYLASPAMMNDYQEYFNKCESEGHHLQNSSKRLETAQVFFSPSSKDKLESILKDGFSGMLSISFYKNPLQCVEENLDTSSLRVLLQCRILLVGHSELNNKYIIKNGKGVLPGFLVEYSVT